MLPFWMELTPGDLIQGTAALGLAISFLAMSVFGNLRRV